MEIYLLDASMRRSIVIDLFVSVVWAERYRELGDFEMVCVTTPALKNALKEGVFVACNESYRVMRIETVEITVSPEGESLIKVSGTSLEKVFMHRVARQNLDAADPPEEGEESSGNPTWRIEDTPPNIIRYMVQYICITGGLSLYDKIPGLNMDAILPPDTIAEPGEVLTYDQPPELLYDAIHTLCEYYDMGFRILRHPVLGTLSFNVYSGRNRTTAQSIDKAVVFSPLLDNLSNTKELHSIENYINIAHVVSPALGSIFVYEDETSETTSGWSRRILYVDASSITEPGPASLLEMQGLGRTALVQQRALFGFDGEIDQNGSYRYGVDYQVGDIIEQRDGAGTVNYMRVTEQILTCDGEGDKAYPTLTKLMTVTPGSWVVWKNETLWAELTDPVEYWDTLP